MPDAHMPPMHLSHKLWDNFKLWAEKSIKLPHGKQAGARKALHAWIGSLQVLRHLLHHRQHRTDLRGLMRCLIAANACR